MVLICLWKLSACSWQHRNIHCQHSGTRRSSNKFSKSSTIIRHNELWLRKWWILQSLGVSSGSLFILSASWTIVTICSESGELLLKIREMSNRRGSETLNCKSKMPWLRNYSSYYKASRLGLIKLPDFFEEIRFQIFLYFNGFLCNY